MINIHKDAKEVYLQQITIADKDHHLTNRLMPDQLNSDQAQRQSKLADNHALVLQVAIQPLDSDAGIDAVKELAIAVWYRGFVPTNTDLETIRQQVSKPTSHCSDETSFLRLLCVLELLSLFAVCKREAASELQWLTERFHSELVEESPLCRTGRYNAGQRWRLAEPINRLQDALLPLQTRHFADTMGGGHGFAGDEH